MKVTRIFSQDGESYFEDTEVPLENLGSGGRFSAPVTTKSVIFRETDSDYNLDFHPAPRRQYVINLTGSVEIETGLGEKRVLGPGSILLAEDTSDRGHISRAIEGEARQCLFITLE